MKKITTHILFVGLSICFIMTALGTLSPKFRAGVLITTYEEDVVKVIMAFCISFLCLFYVASDNKLILRATTIFILLFSISTATSSIVKGFKGFRGAAVWYAMAILILLVHKGERKSIANVSNEAV